jgi:hypothetical protein
MVRTGMVVVVEDPDEADPDAGLPEPVAPLPSLKQQDNRESVMSLG